MDKMPASQAVEALIHEYYKLVFHTIYGLTNDWEESQDLTQDTFQQALKSVDAARATSGPQFHAKAWLLRIALNMVRMQRRRRTIARFIPFSHMQERKLQEYGDSYSETAETVQQQATPVQPAGYGSTSATEDPANLIAEQDAVRRTMKKLPENLRVCLLLSIVGGLSITEIALMLDLKEAAIRQRLSRARLQFKQAYAYESSEDSFNTSTAATVPYTTNSDQSEKDHAAPLPLTDRLQRLSLTALPPRTRSNYV